MAKDNKHENSYIRQSEKVSKGQFCKELKSNLDRGKNLGKDLDLMSKQAENLGWDQTRDEFESLGQHQKTDHELQEKVYDLKCNND